jgi:peptidyl-prolyl cis-trans isomerase SurA
VGRDVITLDQLRRAIKEPLSKLSPEERRDPRIQKQIVEGVLNNLIQRTLLVQAAKKQMKDPKQIQHFNSLLDKAWTERELPPLLRVHNVSNIHELKVKMAAEGKSLDAIREDFRLDNLAREYLHLKLGPKLTVTLRDKQQYYTEHLSEFDRPAHVVWREISVDLAKSGGRDEALKRATALLARAKRGEDFAKLARAESQGPTARDGGLWETAPGASAVEGVNAALEALAPGGVSEIIEGKDSFHIVKVESKRDAGPARFDEVQDRIKEIVWESKTNELSKKFLEDLKSRTVITRNL